MNLNKNYYSILESSNKDDINLIKKSYYKLSKKYHPDLNDDPNINIIFTELSEAWEVLSDIKSKDEYDKKSKFGKDYNELEEFFKIDMDYNHKEAERTYDDVKKREVLDIIVRVDKDTFDGTVEFVRWVQCPTCKGNGKDMSSRIVIKGLDGKEKIFDADDGCDFCFEENNFVSTKYGRVKISDIKVGDLVLSSDNSYQKVTHLLRRNYTGDVFDLSAAGLKIQGVTSNHKLNIVRFKKNNHNRIKIKHYEILELPASEVTTDDFIIYQFEKLENIEDYVILEKTHNRKSKKIKIDEDFVKFIACYISEGNTRGDRVSVFSFHKEKDKLLIEFIQDYIRKNFDSKISTPHNSKWGESIFKIEIFDSQLAKFLKNFCGYLSKNKFINLSINSKFDDLLLNTLLLCDGYKKKSFSTYTTVSEKLALQVFHLSQKLGYNASIRNYIGHIDKNGVNHQDCYRVYMNKSSKMGAYKKVIGECVCLKVDKVKKRKVDSIDVFNITVENTNKYTIDGLLVNNCEGTGKGWDGNDCGFCNGKGKAGINPCKKCSGDGRIQGKQKLKDIKLEGDETKIESMGNWKFGRVGSLIIRMSHV
jgi:hypothetical protein